MKAIDRRKRLTVRDLVIPGNIRQLLDEVEKEAQDSIALIAVTVNKYGAVTFFSTMNAPQTYYRLAQVQQELIELGGQ